MGRALGSYSVAFVAVCFGVDVVPCLAQAVEVQVRLTKTPSMEESTDLPPSVENACIGSRIFLEVWVINWGPEPSGVAGGSVDVAFDPVLVEGTDIDHGVLFDELTVGVIENASGLVNDLGGHTLESGVASEPAWAPLASVAFTAISPGNVNFSTGPGDFRFALAGGMPPLDFDQDVVFGPPANVLLAEPHQLGDFDCDGRVDLDDYMAFQLCLTGPLALAGSCVDEGPDLNADGSVDLLDFAILERIFTGANR